MSSRLPAFSSILMLLALAAMQAGCSSIGGDDSTGGLSQFAFPLPNGKQRMAEEVENRKKFVEDRDPEAMRWLLVNRIRQGMTLADVNRVLGVVGEREFTDKWIKSNRPFRAGDNVYRWGPDNNGRSVYLVFREDQLVNYDSSEFE